MSRFLSEGRYQLDTRLGAGGMGDVWLAYDTKMNRAVAVKLLALDRLRRRHHRDAFTERMEARYEKEWVSMGRITSNHVARIYDRGREGDQDYLVMERIEGNPLTEYMGGGNTLTLSQTAHWSRQICQGLADAHNVEVVHRDVKPANIMIDDHGDVKIVDFGLARLMDATETHGAGATWQYAAPERCDGEPGTHLSDLYSLGCVMYEMLTGYPPFTSRNGDSMAVVAMHLHDHPTPLRRVRRGVPEKLGDLVMSLLAKRPDQRPQHALTVARLIRQAVEEIPEPRPSGGVVEVSTGPHVNPDYVERIRAQEQIIRQLATENGRSHSSVINARFILAELTGESGDSRGAADLYESLGSDCEKFFGPHNRLGLDALTAMARWIASLG